MGPSDEDLIRIAINKIKGEKERKQKAEINISNILFIIIY
jgi:hypothetical protein